MNRFHAIIEHKLLGKVVIGHCVDQVPMPEDIPTSNSNEYA